MADAGHQENIASIRQFDLSQPVSHIVALPYTSNIEIAEGRLRAKLSLLSEISVMGAIRVWEQYPESMVIIPGETDYQDQPNTSQLMMEHALDRSAISQDSIVPLNNLPDGRALNNTYLQMEAVAHHMAKNTEGILFTGLNFHLKRVSDIAATFGINSAQYLSSEKIHTNVGDPNNYGRYFKLISSMKRSEVLRRMIGRVDTRGKLFTRIMESRGPNLDDIVEINGKLTLERGQAWEKEEALKQQLAAQNS